MFKKYPLIWSGILLAALGLLGGFLLSGDTAVSASDYPLDVKPQADKSAGEWLVVRIYYNSRAELDAVAGQLDIWHVDQEAGYALAMMPPAQYDWLEVLGYKLVIDEKRTAEAGIQAPLDSRFYYYDEDYDEDKIRTPYYIIEIPMYKDKSLLYPLIHTPLPPHLITLIGRFYEGLEK